ncbi:exocyst subunit SEC10 [Rhodotorula paludigena]|uniref:exocyst subunit SEC10 n=1 Tax=Rhodotorula paludigena TaxID=86838 RepID=UPI003174AA7C
MASPFPRDPALDVPSGKQRERSGGQGTAISLDTFQHASFDVARFVTGLMDDEVKRVRTEGAPFDPAPHIRTLEAALAQLLPLRKANAQKTAELERSVAVAERAYRGDVRGAKAGFETVNTQFQALDGKITSVGRTAVRIGEQLESIDRLRQRGSEAHDLILYYNEFAAGDTSRLEKMRKEGGREGRQKVAIAARRLLGLSKEIEGVEGAERTRETIERYCERFEKDMLRLFDRYYRKGDPKAMAHCAQTLQEFNGGQSCIQIYVNQHDFFISKERVQEAAGGLVGGAIWESLPDPDSSAPKDEPGLASLYEEIRVTVGQEAQIVTAVFPNPAVVMQVFLQRVFAQVIQGYIETLIQTASSSSTLAYLRILHLARAQTNSLVDDLKSHEFFRASSASSSSALAFASSSLLSPLGLPATGGGGSSASAAAAAQLTSPQASAFPAGAASAGAAAVSQMLDGSMEELFVPYMEGARYLEKEGKSLTELYAARLIRFTNWHRAMNKAKPHNTIFDRVVNQLSSAAHQAAHPGAPNSSSSASSAPAVPDQADASRLDRLMKFSGLSNIVDKGSSSKGGDGDHIRPELMYEDGDGELSIETAEKMLEWHAEAVGRMVELSPASDVPKNAFTLLKVLADSFGKAYLETALDTAIHQLSLYDGKNEPDLSPIAVIRLADMIMHLWQRYISTALVPLAGTSVTVRREMGIFNNHVSVRIEGKVNAIVQRTTDAIISHLSLLLAKQKKADFKPKNDDLAFARLNTEPCLLACDFLAKVREAASGALSGRNAEIFLTEVGVTFHTLLLEHLKKFPVSATGGLMLTKDLALYQDTIATFALPALNDRFEMLRQLGNVFIVQPDILRSYLNEAYLARIENRLLRPFVMMRSDYGDYPRRFWDDVFGPDAPLPSAATAADGSPASDRGGGVGGAVSALGARIPGLSSLGAAASSAAGAGAAGFSSSAGFIAQSFGARAGAGAGAGGSPASSVASGGFQPQQQHRAQPSSYAPGGAGPPALPPRDAARPSFDEHGYGYGHGPPQPPPRPSSAASQRSLNRAGGGGADAAGAAQAAGRKQSLFGTLMRDFEGLGLRDEGGGYASGSEGAAGGKRRSVQGGGTL